MKDSLVQLTRYWHIVRFKTYANLKRDIDKTYLGTLWWVLEPILSTAVFYVVFTHIIHNRTPNMAAFLFIGNVVYNHFASSINGGANAIVGNAGLMQQVQLPKSIYPIIAIANLSWKFVFSLVVVFPLFWILHCPVSLPYLALPVLLFLQLFVVVSVSMPLSILMPYFQDGRTLLSTLLGIMIWVSGVFFPLTKVPEAFRPWFYLNPAVPLIEGYRDILMNQSWPRWSHFLPSLTLCALALASGFWLIRKLGGQITKRAL
ncbi:MAG: ABC transporter permease [Verrucomicrobium sp.]|nr:ABC transporter permease [Verrucomicrobium sp.]